MQNIKVENDNKWAAIHKLHTFFNKWNSFSQFKNKSESSALVFLPAVLCVRCWSFLLMFSNIFNDNYSAKLSILILSNLKQSVYNCNLGTIMESWLYELMSLLSVGFKF